MLQPRPAIATMVSGMEMARSRHVVIQLRHPKGLSIFRPAPIREMITANSVTFSVI
jgi:hypothetical protein